MTTTLGFFAAAAGSKRHAKVRRRRMLAKCVTMIAVQDTQSKDPWVN